MDIMDKNRLREIKYGSQGLFLMFGFPALYNILIYLTGIEKLGSFMIFIHAIKYILLLPALYYFFFCYRKTVAIIFIGCAFTAVMLFAGLNLGGDLGKIVSPLIYFFAYTMVTMACLSLLRKPDVILDKFRNIAYIGSFEILIVCLCGNILHTYPGYTDYMVMGNGGVIYVSALFYWAAKERKIFDIVLSAVTLIFYALFASRGALFALIVVFLYYLLFGNVGVSGPRRMFWIVLLSGIGSIVLNNLKAILFFVADIASSRGWSFGKLIQAYLYMGNLYQSKSRLGIWLEAKKYIDQNWLFGSGPMASIKLMGGYAHNMELDIILDYGLIFGGVIIVAIWGILITLLFGKRNREWANVCAVFVLPGFVILQLSGYWYSASYIMILFYLRYLSRKRLNTTEELSILETNYVKRGNFI